MKRLRSLPALGRAALVMYLLGVASVLVFLGFRGQALADGSRARFPGSSTPTGWSTDGTTTSTTQLISSASGVFAVAANGDVVTRKITTANGSNVGDITCRGDFYQGSAAQFSIGYANRALTSDGSITTTSTLTRGACTFNGASPATCTATVLANAVCTCAPVGATAAIAGNGCAVGLSATTLTITGPNAAAYAVNYHCL